MVDRGRDARLGDEALAKRLVLARCGAITFSATGRSRSTWIARYTTPIPPRPATASMRWPAKTSPGPKSVTAPRLSVRLVSIATSMRPSSALRAAAWGVVVVGVAVPLARRRLRIPPPVVTASAAAAPVALCVATRRSRSRDAAVCALQMWAYIATYQMPHDDPEALEARVRVDYPVAIDRVIGMGRLPTLRLQRALARPGALRPADQALVWVHWIWFLVPHGTVAYLIVRHREQFPAGAARIYAVFDLGVIVYWLLPTAPPWYAAKHGRIGGARARRPCGGSWSSTGGVLEGALAAALQFPGRQPPGSHAVFAFRHLSDGGSRPCGRWPGPGRSRLDVRADARVRLGVSG